MMNDLQNRRQRVNDLGIQSEMQIIRNRIHLQMTNYDRRNTQLDQLDHQRLIGKLKERLTINIETNIK